MPSNHGVGHEQAFVCDGDAVVQLSEQLLFLVQVLTLLLLSGRV